MALDLRQLGRDLAAERVRRGLRQEDVAKGLGLSRFTVMRIEAGEPARLDSVAAYAALVGHPLADALPAKADS